MHAETFNGDDPSALSTPRALLGWHSGIVSCHAMVTAVSAVARTVRACVQAETCRKVDLSKFDALLAPFHNLPDKAWDTIRFRAADAFKSLAVLCSRGSVMVKSSGIVMRRFVQFPQVIDVVPAESGCVIADNVRVGCVLLGVRPLCRLCPTQAQTEISAKTGQRCIVQPRHHSSLVSIPVNASITRKMSIRRSSHLVLRP